MKPPISVIMATRNYGHYLPKAIESVQRQTWTDYECLIIDDGSSDATPMVVRPYLSDTRFRYIQTSNLGQPRAKNLGLELSHAPLITYLDADDLWLPSKLERQLRLHRAHPELGLIYTRRSLIDPEGRHLPWPGRPQPRGMVLPEVLLSNPICFSSVMFRRSVVEHVGGFDPSWQLAIDYDLWLRASRYYPFDYIDEPLVRYRTGHANLSRNVLDRLATALAIQRRFLERWQGAEAVSEAILRESWASTFRNTGYMLRDRDLLAALRWYLRALSVGHGRRATFRAILAACVYRLRRQCSA